MSKLDDLINELCHDGVEYKKLETLAEIGTGSSNTNEELEDGLYPFYVRSQEVRRMNSFEFDETAIITAGDGVGVGKVFHLAKGKYALHQRAYRIHVTDENLSTEFLFHYMKATFYDYITKNQFKASVQSIRRPMLNAYEIPVPPLEVQNEIVRILDKFTSLEAELEAELEARRKQYEYYRDSLLTFGNDVEWKTLGEIATAIYRGAGIKRDQVTPEGIPCVRYGEIYTSYNIHFNDCISHTTIDNVPSPKYFEHGDILFAITGESVEDIAKSIAYMGNEKCLAGGDIVVLKHNQNPKYLSFALSTNDAIMQKGKGKVKSKVVHSSVPSISEIKIPIPDLETQERIANTLDNFLQLTNNITAGLPAEIEARHKQYEYYRDKLLTFKRKEVKV